MEKRGNAGHGRSIASDSMSGNNSDHSGDRLRQNGEKHHVKTATTRFIRLPSRLDKIVMWFRHYYVAYRQFVF